MGTEERQPDADLSDRDKRFAAVERDARRFAFFQLVYVLERMYPGAAQVGLSGPVSEERIRFTADPGLVFASSDVAGAARKKDGSGVERVHVGAYFMGLVGSVSPLPVHYVERIALDNYQGGPQPTREFLDVFHHRLLSLVYRAWAKYRFAVGYRMKGRDPFTRRMFCTVGIDGFRDYDTVIDRFLLLKYAPLLSSKSKSARGLEVVLTDLFGKMGAKLEQFVGQWTLIEKPHRNKLGVANHVLGESLTIGRYVYDGAGRFNVVMGPLKYEEYLSFLPGGHRRPLMRSVVGTFTPGIHDVMLELHVKTEDAPRFQLGSPRASTLSRTAWLGGSAGGEFVITVPLEEKTAKEEGEEDDEDRGEPPPPP